MAHQASSHLATDPELRLYTRRQTAELTGLSVRTIRNALKSGLLNEVNVGLGTRAVNRISSAELARFIEARTAALAADREASA